MEEWPGVDLMYLGRSLSTQAAGSGPAGQGGRGNFGCGCLFIILIGIGIASFFTIGRNAYFPGDDSIHTAGEETQNLYRQARESIGNLGESSPDAAPTPDPPLRPDQRHHDFKLYMLELINEERVSAGVLPVTLGDNIAAQLHAENSLANCFSGHWGADGLKPYMRYSLAGGYQSNGENGIGSDYCIQSSDGYRSLSSIESEIQEMMDGWMNSPGHRRNILDKWHKKANIGLAWDKYNIVGYQHFEGGYVEYARPPEITNGTLHVLGSAINGLRFSGREELGLQLFYDQPPHPLTRGQVSRTYCYDSGLQIAAFRYPLTGRSFWTEDNFTKTYSPCPDPYDVPPDAFAPRSHDEAREFWQRAYDASQTKTEQTITVPCG